jgi:phosphatidylglycerophosphate synthase
MKKQIPLILIFTRLGIGIVLVLLSLLHIKHFAITSIVLLSLGLLTDIFDGIIARRLNISTQKLRRLDSTIDQIFFTLVLLAAFINSSTFFTSHATWLIILISLELLTYLVCFVKFKKEIATHSIGAKIWTLFLFATLVQVLALGQASALFFICFWLGIISRVEIIGILLILKKWTNDVPTIYHAWLLRKNKNIKRHKLFNG